MLATVVFVPSAPLLVPELAGPGAVDTEPVRSATRAAGRRLASVASRWVAVGAADREAAPTAPQEYLGTGDFGAYGVAVTVDLGLSHESGSRRLPLSMLIAGWLRQESGAHSVTPRVIAADATAAECAEAGRVLAADIAATDAPIGVLVVGDGSFALSDKSPGGGRDADAVALQQQIDRALSSGATDILAGLDPAICEATGVGGRAAWQVAAALCEGRRLHATASYTAAPFGVGYIVAEWTVENSDG